MTEPALLALLIGPSDPDCLRTETLVSMFRASAAQYPTQPALVFDGETLNYATLDHWSDHYAHHMQQRGATVGDAVLVYLPRGVELHVAVLAILKSGACYVPIDREMPHERVVQIAEEINARLVITDAVFAAPLMSLTVPDLRHQHEKVHLNSPDPDATAYVIYTSGSTGKPKGIPITHRMICHLVRAEQRVLQVRADDRVYQGFSVSFDMWCEEVWLSYLVGACLIVADTLDAKALDELPQFWNRHGVTVLHAVPSLLALLDGRETPKIRVVNTGGEACTPQVVERWWTPERLLINSYGPSETTVSASMGRLMPHQPITLGAPLAHYGLAVVDEQLNLLPYGVSGELIVSGMGVSDGYIGRPELTAEKFLVKPASLDALPGARIYRTGDRVQLTPDGALFFEGRMDDQVKLRGYRIELGEIETACVAWPEIRAAVALIVGAGPEAQLVLAVELASDFQEIPAEWKTRLSHHLPPYMVPVEALALEALPRLASGKINRKAVAALFQPVLITADHAEVYGEDEPVATRLMTALRAVFPGKNIDLAQDFFTDLGGHSLLAASLVSRLRARGYMQHAALRDVYLHRPLTALATQWEKANAPKPKIQPFAPVPRARLVGCTIAQTIALFFLYGLFSLQIFLPYLAYYYTQQEYESHLLGISVALLFFLLLPPCFTALSIAGKRVIGRFVPGDYPVWGFVYFRYWLMGRLLDLSPIQFFNDTPFYNWYVKRLGMKVGPYTHLGRITFGIPELITIGHHATLSTNVVLDNATIEKGWLKLRHITIGDYAYLGSSVVIAGDAQMGRYSELADLSCLGAGKVIPPAELWQGSPAVFSRHKRPEELISPFTPSRRRFTIFMLLYAGVMLAFPLVLLVPIIPTMVVLNILDSNAPDYDFTYLMISPLLASFYVGLFILITVGLTRLLIWRLPAGSYPLYSRVYLRKWLVDQLHSLSLFVVHPLFASQFARPYFRALGAKIGRGTEISTVSNATPHLLTIGANSFIADAVTLGEVDIRYQQIIIKPTVIGDRTFIGNSAIVPQGNAVPSDQLLGVLSLAPETAQYQPGVATYLGSPALGFPQREITPDVPLSLTFAPSAGRKIARGLIEFIRIILPTAVTICCSALFIAYAHDLLTKHTWWEFFLQLSFYYLTLVGLPAFGIVLLMKWILIGRYHAQSHPMWTLPVWLSEAVTSSYEGLAVPFLLTLLKGTLWLPLCLRLLGVRVGQRVILNSTDFTEFDCVSIGDDSVFNTDSGPQTHLFEDRIMKIGAVTIGARCSIGSRSIVLYDTRIGNDVTLDPLSLVMKGETLPPGSAWQGSPIQPS